MSHEAIFLRRGSKHPKFGPIVELNMCIQEIKSDLVRAQNLGQNLETAKWHPLSIGHAQKIIGRGPGHEQKMDVKMMTSSKPVS